MRRALLLLLATGCADEIFRPCGEYTPDWDGVKCTIDTHCVSCHDGYYPVVLPDDLIVDIEEGRGWFVTPGSPEESKLWRVISGKLCSGDEAWCDDPDLARMPLGSQPLPKSEWAHIEEWILAGAPLE